MAYANIETIAKTRLAIAIMPYLHILAENVAYERMNGGHLKAALRRPNRNKFFSQRYRNSIA